MLVLTSVVGGLGGGAMAQAAGAGPGRHAPMIPGSRPAGTARRDGAVDSAAIGELVGLRHLRYRIHERDRAVDRSHRDAPGEEERQPVLVDLGGDRRLQRTTI